MNRRDFIINGCGACLSAMAVSTLIPSCQPTKYSSSTLSKNGLTVSKDEFKLTENGHTAYRSFIIVRNAELKYPICVYRFSETEYAALWMSCTHRGVELQASGDQLQCPAHGSGFNNKGQVTSGPADTALRSFPVTINKNDLFIDLRKS